MVSASHYIFMDLLNLHNNNRGRLREVCEVYGQRYSDDEEFQEITGMVLSAVNSRDESALNGLEARIRELVISRRNKPGNLYEV